MKVKVCGMKYADNLAELTRLAPDYVGFIFHPKSPRFVEDPAQVEPVLREKGIRRVGVFVNPSLEEVLEKADRFHLDLVQLHGDESPGFCAAVAGFVPVAKAFRLDDQFDFAQTLPYEAVSDVFVFDARGKHYGGNGHKFNWEVLQQYAGTTPFLLSGGIGPDDAVGVKNLRHAQYLGVDVNSGFESEPGRKEVGLLRGFIEEVKTEQK